MPDPAPARGPLQLRGTPVAPPPVFIPDVPDDALYEIKYIHGKGRSLVARVDILKGRQILDEAPYLAVMEGDDTMLDNFLESMLGHLDQKLERHFHSLGNERT